MTIEVIIILIINTAMASLATVIYLHVISILVLRRFK